MGSVLVSPPIHSTHRPSLKDQVDAFTQQICEVIVGKTPSVKLAVACLLARGHLLIEDIPGVGKTTLSQALARSLGLRFQRIQFERVWTPTQHSLKLSCFPHPDVLLPRVAGHGAETGLF